MLPLALAASVVLARPSSLDLWRWQIEAMDWTWRETSPDRQVEVFTRPVKDAATPEFWVRTERYDGRWKSRVARLKVDCAKHDAAIQEVRFYGGMNLSGEVLDGGPREAPPVDGMLQPILRSACGS